MNVATFDTALNSIEGTLKERPTFNERLAETRRAIFRILWTLDVGRWTFSSLPVMPNNPRLPEITRGTEVFAVDPLTIRAHFEVDYLHSYKQDTPFFHGLAKRKLLGSHCPKCHY